MPGAGARSHTEAAFADKGRASCHWIFFLGEVLSALVITETSCSGMTLGLVCQNLIRSPLIVLEN